MDPNAKALRECFPLRIRVLIGNPYGIPPGKTIEYARRKDGDGSPWPVEAFSYGGNYVLYQFAENEVEVMAPE